MTAPAIGRRSFLAATAAGAASLLLPRRARASQQAPAWHDVKTWGVEGKGWTDAAAVLDQGGIDVGPRPDHADFRETGSGKRMACRARRPAANDGL